MFVTIVTKQSKLHINKTRSDKIPKPNNQSTKSIDFMFLLLGFMQLKPVYPFPKAQDIYLQPYLLSCFCFSSSPSFGSFLVSEVFLLFYYRTVSTGRSFSVNEYHPFYGGIHIILIPKMLCKKI